MNSAWTRQLESMRKILLLALALSLPFGLTSCSNPATVTHPGAVNAFDSNAYDALITAQAAIEQAKVGIAPQYKTQLNQVIAGYNAAMHAYQVYHAAAVAGSSPDPAALQAQISQLVASVAALVTQVKPQ